MERWADFLAWTHSEMGYTFSELRERTWPELNALQLGHVVGLERKNENARSVRSGSMSDEVKRQHKNSIRQRLMN